ncbi:MAG: nuclear transport factor 2 family protein [Breznakibacter sp.]|nr:nuclear transport factor 2 family protein [Breznakibacter sp.]
MKTIITIVAIFICCIGCNPNKGYDSPEVLKQVVLDYFHAIENNDYRKMEELTTMDFILYEDGKIWNNDSLIDYIKKFPNSKISFTLKDFKINIDQSSGSMNYLNHADFSVNDTTQIVLNWIESACLIKQKDGWKMSFMHSTPQK